MGQKKQGAGFRGTYIMYTRRCVSFLEVLSFKDMTDLWSVKRKGMMPVPDFGLFLSRDRFRRILWYWARGPEGTSENLKDNPWEEVDYWVCGFNKNRREEIEVGTNVTPDEMTFAWRGKKGNGGIPHLSFLKRKPIPLGTESKVCGVWGDFWPVHVFGNSERQSSNGKEKNL